MAVCVAILDRENAPFYVRTSGGCDADLKLHLFLYATLDLIDSYLTPTSGKGSEHGEQYLGPLFNSEDYVAYGYVTCSKFKVFKRIHSAYCSLLLNPFYRLGSSPKSKSLDELADSILLSGAD